MEKNNKRHEVWRSLRGADFQEDDVWDVLDESSSFMIINHTTKPSFSTRSLIPSEPRMIPERQKREGMAPMTQHSAPVNIVSDHWSVMDIKKTKKVDDDENVSPEEYFMRRSRRSSSSSSSVMEGVGRKLKGRDLSKVRDAVLKKTGFLE